MSEHRYPVLTWEDGQGGHTAALVEFPDVAAFGDSEADALARVEALLAWRRDHEPWNLPVPDFHAPKLCTLDVSVRPELPGCSHLPPGWTHPVPPWMAPGAPTAPPLLPDRAPAAAKGMRVAGNPIVLKVIAVRGHQAGGLATCSLPTLGLTFAHPVAPPRRRHPGGERLPAARISTPSWRDHATQYVREALAGLGPRELSRHQAPPGPRLAQVVIPAPEGTPKR